MITTLREDMPSSGSVNHTCSWQCVETTATQMTLVCTHPDCKKTKIVPKPKVEESKTGKSVLLG